jgi:GntR family transcriptional regulator of vanillate catabolism
MSDDTRETLAGCIAEGAAVLAKGFLVDEDIGRWGRLNKRFHDALVDAQESRVIADAIARNNHLPFASADSLALDRAALPSEYQKLRIAQLQHQLVFDALAQRESARVEMLMREHAWVGFRYGQLFDAAPAPSPALS